MPASLRKYRNYLFVIPLCAAALFYQITYSVVAVETNLEGVSVPDTPFDSTNGTASQVSKAAQAAGLHPGDRLLAIDGKAVTDERELFEDVDRHKPGDLLNVTEIPRGQFGVRTVRVPIEALSKARSGSGDLAFVLGIASAILFCVVIGAYVAIRRPYDKRALLAFSLIVSLAQVVGLTDWYRFPEWLWLFAKTWKMACILNWSVAILAFGLYFPERFAWEIKRPWLKWLYLGPLIAVNILVLFSAVVPEFSFREEAALKGVTAPLNFSQALLIAISITLFFVCMGVRQGKAIGVDAKRRLRLLGVGAAVGLCPIGLLLLYEVVGRKGEEGLPQALLITICVLFVVFPLTLAYTVLTERAMDVRVVVRQGMRYALARSGVRVLIFALGSLFFWRLSVFLVKSGVDTGLQVVAMALGVALWIFVIRRVSSRAFLTLDKKFFREHYEAEALLSELSENVHTIRDENQLLQTVSRRVSDALHISHFCVLMNGAGDNRLRPVYAMGLAVPNGLELPQEAQTVSLSESAKDPSPIYFDRPENWVHSAPAQELVTLKALGAQLLLPLKSKDRLLGLFCLGPKLSEEPFSKTDINLLRSVAMQTGLALDNSRLTAAFANEVAQRERLNREIEIAREVQERLFPQHLPVIAGVDYCGACRPALGVGGDYYDFLNLPNGDLGVAIGDVSGKGIAAALLMASLQASLRGQALSGTTDLAQLISNVNRLVFDATPMNRYATFFYGQYSRDTRVFRYVNAGHNPPFILRRTKDGSVHVIRLEAGGPVVGLFPEAPYQQAALVLEPGDVFVGFTDGISEAMNRAEEEWGEERLIPTAAAVAGEPASQIIPSLMTEADRFADGAPQHDDMTLVVIKMQSDSVSSAAA